MKIALLALALTTAMPVAAITLTFEDLPAPDNMGQESAIDVPYDGFTFSNFDRLDTTSFPASGYHSGVVSGTNVAFNGSGRTASAVSAATPFSLTSGYFAAAWNDGLTIQLTGKLAGATVFTQSFVVDTSHVSFEILDPALIDTVVFTASGGVHHAGWNYGLGTQLSLDDLTINGTVNGTGSGETVPEPAVWAMMVAGFGLVGGALRRPRLRTA